MTEEIQFFVEAAGRLDAVLARQAPTFSRSQWRRWIQAGAVQVNGNIVERAAFAAPEGAQIVANIAIEPEDLVPCDMPLDIMHEDAAIVVVNKPAGLVVHPGARRETETLVHGLIAKFPDILDAQADVSGRPGIVHRLDKGTSGLMVVARTNIARHLLVKQFQERLVEKYYCAWVYGRVEGEGRWQGAIGRHQKDRKRFAVRPDGKPARTDYKAISTRAEVTRLHIRIHSGRTHQIRVHALAAGTPLLGDSLYWRGRISQRMSEWGPERGRPALHASQLAFLHPLSGEQMSFDAPLPDDLASLERALDAY